MTYRAGSMDKSRPDWRGLIRDDRFPVFECTHYDHKTRDEAKQCATNAVNALKKDPKTLPAGWREYQYPRQVD